MYIDPKYILLILRLKRIVKPRDYADLVRSLFANAPEDVKSRVNAMIDILNRNDISEIDKIREIGRLLGLEGSELEEFVSYMINMREYIEAGVKYISTNEEI